MGWHATHTAQRVERGMHCTLHVATRSAQPPLSPFGNHTSSCGFRCFQCILLACRATRSPNADSQDHDSSGRLRTGVSDTIVGEADNARAPQALRSYHHTSPCHCDHSSLSRGTVRRSYRTAPQGSQKAVASTDESRILAVVRRIRRGGPTRTLNTLPPHSGAGMPRA